MTYCSWGNIHAQHLCVTSVTLNNRFYTPPPPPAVDIYILISWQVLYLTEFNWPYRGAQAPQDKVAVRLMQQSVQWAGIEDSQRTLDAESIHCQDLSRRLFSEGGRLRPCCSGRRPCVPSCRLHWRLIGGTVHAAFVIVSVDITSFVHPFVSVLITCRTMKSLSVHFCQESMHVFGTPLLLWSLHRLAFHVISWNCIF